MLQETSPDTGGGASAGGGSGAPGEMGGEGMGFSPGEAIREKIEVSAEAKKKFQAQQAAVKALWAEEQKFKKDDSKVANIIIKFLQSSAHTKFFILIARLVARNLPSNFILAILSLIHKESSEIINKEIKSLATEPETLIASPANNLLPAGATQSASIDLSKSSHQSMALQVKIDQNFQSIPPEIKKRIDEWTQTIYLVGKPMPAKIVAAVINPDNSIEDSLFQLTTFVLQEFLNKNHIKNEYEEIRNFIEIVITSIINKYKKEVDDQKLLKN